MKDERKSPTTDQCQKQLHKNALCRNFEKNFVFKCKKIHPKYKRMWNWNPTVYFIALSWTFIFLSLFFIIKLL